MAKTIYTAEAHVTGGRVHGHGRTSDGALDVQLRPPGGEEQGTNPEQLFAVGYAACFQSALMLIGRRQKLDLDASAVDAKVDLVAGDDRNFDIAATLDVTLPDVDDEQAVEIVRAAHGACPYSRATRGNMQVTLTANGRPV